MREQPGKSVTDEVVITELRRVAEMLGRTDLTVEEFNSYGSFSVATARSRFKTWQRALEAAGLNARPTSVRYSDEECYENLLRVWTHLGRPPKYREMNVSPSRVGGKAYMMRWGSWLKALEDFVKRVNQDDVVATCSNEDARPRMGPPQSKNDSGDDGRIRLGLRYKTLVRDNFKCVLCGNSPSRDPSCRLHVDHVHPHAKDGLTVPENLRTLCDACNLGKGKLTIEATSL